MSEFTYFEDGQIDRVMSVIWQLSQEAYVARQRILALEKLLADKGIIDSGELDGVVPSDEARSAASAEGDQFVNRLLRPVSELDDHRMPLRNQFAGDLSKVE